MLRIPVCAFALSCATLAGAQPVPEVLSLDRPPAPVSGPPVSVEPGSEARLPLIDLERAWAEAWERDPTLRAARAASLVAAERVPLAESQRLPQVQFSASYVKNDIDRTQLNFLGRPVSTEERYASRNQTLSVRQALYRPALLAALDQADAIAQQGLAQLRSQEQQLTRRLLQAYLQTLLAQEQIRLIEAQAKAIDGQLRAAEQAFARGVGTRTDVDETRARRDLNEAQRLQAALQLQVARRRLQALVGVGFDRLAPLQPAQARLGLALGRNANAWVERALQASPELMALRAQLDAAVQEVRRLRAGHLPTLDAIAQWQKSTSENVNQPNSGYTNRAVGLQLQVPIYSGGAVSSQVRQAQHEVDRLREALAAQELELGVQVHSALQGVTDGVARVGALLTAEQSAVLALESAQRSFQAGVRSTLDVLDAQQRLAQVRLDLTRARHDALQAHVDLHALAGLVDDAFLQQLMASFGPAAAP
jgi:outer membrane protein/protease secretion system outer membrane protein